MLQTWHKEALGAIGNKHSRGAFPKGDGACGGVLTHSIDQHGQAAQGSDGVREVCLGKVEFADVSTDFLHHDFTRLCLAPDLPNLAK